MIIFRLEGSTVFKHATSPLQARSSDRGHSTASNRIDKTRPQGQEGGSTDVHGKRMMAGQRLYRDIKVIITLDSGRAHVRRLATVSQLQ